MDKFEIQAEKWPRARDIVSISTATRNPVSLRDPGGYLIRCNDSIFRQLFPSISQSALAFLSSDLARQWMDSGKLVRTKIANRVNPEFPSSEIDSSTSWTPLLLEHESIWFPSYPSEWTPHMLSAAARLTLEISRDLLKESRGLKDATPYNILFRGTAPVLVDFLSIEDRNPFDSTWRACAQFVSTFMAPLMASHHLALPLATVFAQSREGIDPIRFNRMLGLRERFSPQVFKWIQLPTWLNRFEDQMTFLLQHSRSSTPKQAQFILNRLYLSLERAIDKYTTVPSRSKWSDYESRAHYNQQEKIQKLQFVDGVLGALKPSRVLDVGTNKGEFALAAARLGHAVVAIDSDPSVLEALWSRASLMRANVLPLNVNLAWPTPAMGWDCGEFQSFVDRSRGKFDMVLMLAILHHLMITEGIPLANVAQLASELTAQHCIVEFVPSDDPMFQRLLRGRANLYEGYSQQWFESIWLRNFNVCRSLTLHPTGRVLYHLKKR